MAPVRKRSKPPELKVVFDTSAIYTDSEAFLVKREVADLVRAASSHSDLRVSWYIPELARLEREYQMRENGFALLPAIGKIERVLKHNLNITKQIITDRVRSLVDEQLLELGVQVLRLDTHNVDWPRIITDAAHRILPFERGDKEKGFRDAVIMESFLQLVQTSPKTASVCRIALVAGDGGLRKATEERVKKNRNVRILTDLGELKGLINTLVAKIDEDFVAKIRPAAAKYFYDRENKAGLWYREKIAEGIPKTFASKLKLLPPYSDGKELETRWIATPRFSKKEKQRVYWVSRITYEYKTYRLQDSPLYINLLGAQQPIEGQQPLGLKGFSGLAAYQQYLKGAKSPSELTVLPSGEVTSAPASFIPPPQDKIYGKNWRLIFDVTWSVIVTAQRHKFSSPKIESIEFVDAVS
jgi:PIN domain